MQFNEEDFGKRISEQLSDYLREFTTTNDRAVVAEKLELSTSIIRDLVFRNRTLTAKNFESIIELTKIAVDNCNDKIKRAETAKEYLELELTF